MIIKKLTLKQWLQGLGLSCITGAWSAAVTIPGAALSGLTFKQGAKMVGISVAIGVWRRIKRYYKDCPLPWEGEDHRIEQVPVEVDKRAIGSSEGVVNYRDGIVLVEDLPDGK